MANIVDHPQVQRLVVSSYAQGLLDGALPTTLALLNSEDKGAALIQLRNSFAKTVGALSRVGRRSEGASVGRMTKMLVDTFMVAVFIITKKKLAPNKAAWLLTREGAADWDAFLTKLNDPQEIERML